MAAMGGASRVRSKFLSVVLLVPNYAMSNEDLKARLNCMNVI